MSDALFGGRRRVGSPDASAGVSLVRGELCPRCGLDKGAKGHARRGLCRDCADVLPVVERKAWAA